MPRRLPFLLVATALLSLGGCASSQANTRTEPSAQAKGEAPARPACAMCPMNMEGVQVAASDVEGGVALSFTTATGDVAALRAQVARMAERHNAHHAGASSAQGGCCPRAGQGQDGPAHHGRHAAKGQAMGMPGMAAKASAEEVPGGARMVLKAEDPANIEALRQHVHRHAEMMSKGGCCCGDPASCPVAR